MKRNILVFALLAGLAVSAFGQRYNGPFEIEEKNGNLTITGLRDGFENMTELVIPADIFGYPVVAINYGAFSNKRLTSITLPANIDIQPTSFFYSLYDSYMKNGRRATTFTVAYSTFNDFEILIFNNISVEITKYTGSVKAVRIPDRINNLPVTTIESNAFDNNQLTSVTIPNSVTTIGGGAFMRNQLTSVTIPNSVTSIGDSAFDSNQLTSVTIPNSVSTIRAQAFSSNQLTSVVIPNSVTEIGGYAFAGNKLTSIVIPNSVTTIEPAAFMSNQLTSITLPNSVTTIGESAFSGNQLTSVTIPNSVTKIGGYAFSGNKLTSVVIPNRVTEIGRAAFIDNPLVSVTIPESVRKIGDFAFSHSNTQNTGFTLATIIIGSSVDFAGIYSPFPAYFVHAYNNTGKRAGRYVVVRNGGRLSSGQVVDTWERAGSQ